MNLNFRTSLVLLVFCYNLLQSQNDTIEVKNNKLKFLFDESRQKVGDISLSYQIPITGGNNFIGNGFEGTNGYNCSVKFYLYKQFFAGYTFGISNFDVINTSIVGNIASVKVKENFFYLGYEFLPLNRVRLGLSASLQGNTTFTNKIDAKKLNADTGNLRNLGLSLSYEFLENLMLFVNYDFRKIKTNIRVPNDLQHVFEKGSYQTINIGLRFSFGRYDAIDHIYL